MFHQFYFCIKHNKETFGKLPSPSCEATLTPDIHTAQRSNKEWKSRNHFPYEHIPKGLNKYLQTKSRTHQKDRLPWSIRLHSRDSGMVKYMKIYQCNLPYKQTERQKHMVFLLYAEKAFAKNPAPLHDRRMQGTYLNIIKRVYSRLIANINLNREKLKAIPPKSGDKTRLSTLSVSSQYSTWSLS